VKRRDIAKERQIRLIRYVDSVLMSTSLGFAIVSTFVETVAIKLVT
jgi:hypothetical protein